MLPHEQAIEKIGASLQSDPKVQAIFLKGSMGRNEHDEFSDIDLYCLVKNEEVEQFLASRVQHLQEYRKIIYYDDIFIIAPQLIVVFDNLLHLDLFTVTTNNFPKGDFYKILYDPNHLLDSFKDTQGLALTESEYKDDVMDVAWFLFQYRKAASRGNEIWAVKMLTNVMEHLSKVLLYRYAPNRARLGLKTLDNSLPLNILSKVQEILEHNTPHQHRKAAYLICAFLAQEIDWINLQTIEDPQIIPFLQKMIDFHINK